MRVCVFNTRNPSGIGQQDAVDTSSTFPYVRCSQREIPFLHSWAHTHTFPGICPHCAVFLMRSHLQSHAIHLPLSILERNVIGHLQLSNTALFISIFHVFGRFLNRLASRDNSLYHSLLALIVADGLPFLERHTNLQGHHSEVF
jgi:hypothetical protein